MWMLLSTIWGSTWLFIKVGLEYLPPLSFAGIRFLIASIPIALLCVMTGRRLPGRREDWWLITVTGLITFSINYGLIFWAELFITSALAAVLYTTMPLFGLVMAHVAIPSEPMNLRKTLGVLCGILGVTIVFSDQLGLSEPGLVWGASAVVFAAFINSWSTVLIKTRAHHIDSFVLSAGQMVVGCLPLLAVGYVVEGSPFDFAWPTMAWVSLLYLALVGSSLAFVGLYWLIKRMDVTKTQLIPLSSTLIAVVLGWLVLDERFSILELSGAAVILAGLGITRSGFKKRLQPGG